MLGELTSGALELGFLGPSMVERCPLGPAKAVWSQRWDILCYDFEALPGCVSLTVRHNLDMEGSSCQAFAPASAFMLHCFRRIYVMGSEQSSCSCTP